ncbi:sensor histidine kinase [Paenibacillus eucommiae]|uniref:Two-component system sensor histidine kinase YesM n=1 Tax=Paenibacillus eucommiae TaxID=1355755 RepID=A0ABS4IVA1_9BACL|nr:histidine kinase [Paenibacillus eucommiae]MBP1991502.1 two-component system sensor histidine kinase YesM [Paenibacillus eucommiae]
MIRVWIAKYIKSRFLNKLLLLNSLIIISTVSILVFFIFYYISNTLKEQAISYNSQILQSVSSYFLDQNKTFKKTMNYIYYGDLLENSGGYSVIQAFQDVNQYRQSDPSDKSAISSEIVEKTAYIYHFMTSRALPSDTHMSDMLLVNPSFDLQLSTGRNGRLTRYVPTIRDFIDNSRSDAHINSQRIHYIPSFSKTTGRDPKFMYAIYDYLRDPNDPSLYVGYMLSTYDADSVKSAYERFNLNLTGIILILTNDGDIIFDSSGQFYGKPFPYKEIITSPNRSTIINNSIVDIYRDEDYGFAVIGIIPKSDLYKGIHKFTQVILSTTFACLIVILLLSFFGTSIFSKRLANVLHTIKEIQRGNLSARVNFKDRNDEVGLISYNLNIMSEKLEDYIGRELALELRRKEAELKQKTAELYALQSQINPHFLYNTLETIRMTAIITQDQTVSQMIKILAKLIRSSIKDEMMISIDDELRYCRSFLELYSLRFGELLEVIIDIEDEILPYGIPKHLLQPIIENTIFHGINLNKNDNVITVKGSKVNDYIVLSVSDNGHGMDATRLASITNKLKNLHMYSQESIGLMNVESRTRLIYGDNCGLQIKSSHHMGTEVILTILALTKEELFEHVQGFDR